MTSVPPMLDWREYDVVDSTNDVAMQLLRAGAAEGTVVRARAQRAGRGQYGRTWHGSDGANIYCSLIARPPSRAAVLLPLTLVVGIGVVDALQRALPPPYAATLQLKWPNDVWLGGKKCAGILCEAHTCGEATDGVVIGIGVNVNDRGVAWDVDLLSTATSLALATGGEFSVDLLARDLVKTVLARVHTLYHHEFSGELFARFRALDALRDAPILIEGTRHATARGVDAYGRLLVENIHGDRETLVAGSVLKICESKTYE